MEDFLEITMEDFLELEEFLELEDGEQLGDLDSSREVTMEDFLELGERLDKEQRLDDERNTTRKDLETSSKPSIGRHQPDEIISDLFHETCALLPPFRSSCNIRWPDLKNLRRASPSLSPWVMTLLPSGKIYYDWTWCERELHSDVLLLPLDRSVKIYSSEHQVPFRPVRNRLLEDIRTSIFSPQTSFRHTPPGICSFMPSLLDFDDQRVYLGSVNTLWIRHGNVGIRSFCLNSTLSCSSNLVKFLSQDAIIKAVCSSLSNLTQPYFPVSAICAQQPSHPIDPSVSCSSCPHKPSAPTSEKAVARLFQTWSFSKLEDCSPLVFSLLKRLIKFPHAKDHERSFPHVLLLLGENLTIKTPFHERYSSLGSKANHYKKTAGQKIHASCRRSLMYRVQRDLPVGEWRVVENFKISGTGGQYRPTKLQYKMTILGDTTISRTDYRNDNHFLSLARYEEIGTKNLKTYFLIDILGQVVDLGRIMTVEVKGEERKRVLFCLRDTSGNEVACCLWGQYAEQIESHIAESKDDTIICLIRFAKISEFRGELQITNAYDASLLMLNPKWRKLLILNRTLLGNSDEKKIMKHVKVAWNEVDIKYISEILISDEVGSGKIICTIEAINTDWGWYYFGCKRHNRRVTKVGRKGGQKMVQSDKPQFYCEVCHSNTLVVKPKYKLHVFVKDDTGESELMLLDTVATTIIGNKAEELWDGSYAEIEDPEILPIPIKNLVGKSFCFGLSITSDNVSNRSTTFKVAEVWSGDHIHRIESLSEAVSLIGSSSSTLSTSELLK
ncbi:hypothetical protein DY000_02058910 [Brassica cretica]|uniref:Replication factor A C-terminal domain-containing protein n=1 Tax=Brassica cretica TaxID=69181 RepID=A0ABQ7AVF2_BRACR|nr:hypothetical protein DY000_02058910 [Brassica cretica]